jgi:hypothetical protein
LHKISWLEKLRGGKYSEDVGMNWRIILEWVLGNRLGRCELDLSGSGQVPVASYFENDNEPSGSER